MVFTLAKVSSDFFICEIWTTFVLEFNDAQMDILADTIDSCHVRSRNLEFKWGHIRAMCLIRWQIGSKHIQLTRMLHSEINLQCIANLHILQVRSCLKVARADIQSSARPRLIGHKRLKWSGLSVELRLNELTRFGH